MSEAIQAGRFLGMRISPLNRRRPHNFRANQRGFWSLWLFLVLFILSLLAEFIANDRPFLVYYAGDLYVPIRRDDPYTAYGGPFPTADEYQDTGVPGVSRQERGSRREERVERG